MVDISIIIVSYNTIDHIGNCLDSIISTDRNYNKEIFVVDNASRDGSVEFINRCFPSVFVIENPKNRGFATANNQALPYINGRYVFFLNPDTIVMPATFSNAVSFMDESPDIGLAGTKILNPDRSLQESVSYRYSGEQYAKGELAGLSGSIAFVLGASMIARKEVIINLKGFDDDFFLYGEEQDLCLRIRKSGYKIGYIDNSSIIHIGGQSERESVLADVWKKKINAKLLFYEKHYLIETIMKIKKAELFKLWWRIPVIKFSILFLTRKERTKNKVIRYQIIYNAMKAWKTN